MTRERDDFKAAMEFAFRAGYAAALDDPNRTRTETDTETVVYGWMQTRAAPYLDEAMCDPSHPRHLARQAESLNEVVGTELFGSVVVPNIGNPYFGPMLQGPGDTEQGIPPLRAYRRALEDVTTYTPEPEPRENER